MLKGELLGGLLELLGSDTENAVDVVIKGANSVIVEQSPTRSHGGELGVVAGNEQLSAVLPLVGIEAAVTHRCLRQRIDGVVDEA